MGWWQLAVMAVAAWAVNWGGGFTGRRHAGGDTGPLGRITRPGWAG